MGFGKKLKHLLNEKSITVAELSRQTGIPAATLYSIIRRDSTPKSADIIAISNVLGVDIQNYIYKTYHFDKEYLQNLHTAMNKYFHSDTDLNDKMDLQLFAEPQSTIINIRHIDVSDLTDDEIKQVKQYVEFLKSQRNNSTTD